MADLLPLLLDQLDAEAMSVLRLLATLADVELDPKYIGALTDVLDAPALCDRLVDLGLVVGAERGYRCVADVVSVLSQRDAALFSADRLCEYFAGWATQTSTTPFQIAEQAWALEVSAVLASGPVVAGHDNRVEVHQAQPGAQSGDVSPHRCRTTFATCGNPDRHANEPPGHPKRPRWLAGGQRPRQPETTLCLACIGTAIDLCGCRAHNKAQLWQQNK
ncbi:MAG TPA: hypothetical protein VJM46_03380 [Candidatus Saccharimonadales bacterium]|nr:hypothetical protein [Candidatus Saccharimonadales bacterium]